MTPFIIWLYFGLFTYHGDFGAANQTHNPIGIELQYEQASYGYLWFRNSWDRPSWIFYRTGPVQNRSVRLNYLAFVMSGYTPEPFVFIIPVISAKYDGLTTDFACLSLETRAETFNCAITFKIRWR